MNKQFLSIFLFLFIFSHTYSQKNSFTGKVIYEKNQSSPNLTNSKTVLIFDNQKSYFEWFTTKTGIQQENNGTKNYFSNTDKSINVPFFMLKDLIKDEFYTQLINSDKTYLIKQELNLLEWKILDEHKNIDKFRCQKAKVKFKGRNYIGWFTEDIPVPYGPAYFHGLPGLILEVYEEDYFVHFIAKNIVLNNLDYTVENKIKEIDFKNTVTVEEYEEEAQKNLDNLQTKINARLPKGSKPIIFKRNCEDCGGKTVINQ